MLKTETSPRININIVRPAVLANESKARTAEINSSNFNPPSIKSPIARRLSPNNEPHQPPPTPTTQISEIIALNKSKEYMTLLLKELNQVVKENDATPEVQKKLSPLVENVTQSFPAFHAQAVKYYQLYNQIQETTQTHQVLSTASVKIPLTAFIKAWEDLEKMIDIYADTHPPPHAKEISGKFDAIKSSLEIILQTNANRKFPNPGLGKSVLSIQSLCDSITNAVYELFMQERFPNFEIDSLSMYKADVKSFLRVVTDAFYNQFPQSGVALCDLARIKLNVVASCNEIIEALKAAFVFPNSLRSVQKLKNSFNDETHEIIEMLKQQFNVVKPANGNEIVFNTSPVKKTKEEETREKIENDDVEARLRNMDPTRKVELFLHDALPFFEMNLSDFSDCWSALLYLDHQMKDFVKKYEVNEEYLSSLKSKISELKNDVSIANEYAKKKTKVANEVDELRKKESAENHKEVETLKGQISKLKALINEKQEEIEEITKKNEIGQLRNGLERIVQVINSRLKKPHSEEFHKLSHEELINLTLSLEETFCEEQKKEIENIKKIEENREKHQEQEKEIQQDEICIQESAEKTEQQANEKVSDKNKERPPVDKTSSNNIQTAANNNTNLTVSRKGENLAEIKEALISSRKGHFSDLKLIVSKLDGMIVCQYDSTHKEIVKNEDDDSLLVDPVNSRIELNGLINDQFQALQKLFRALLDNDKANQKTIRELTIQMNRFTTELGEALGVEEEPNKLLSMAVNIITDKQNPLHDKIVELSNELRKRDSQETMLISRLGAICKTQDKLFLTQPTKPEENETEETEKTSSIQTINSDLYYEIIKTNTNATMMKLLGIIQDQFDEKSEAISYLEKKSNLIQNFMYDLERRLRNATKKMGSENLPHEKRSFEIDSNEDIEKVNTLIDTIQCLCDKIVSPRFSDEFVHINELKKMFQKIPHDENKHPTEFIPQVCEKFLLMQTAINSTKPFLVILDEIFQGFDDQGKTLKNNNSSKCFESSFNEQQFQLLLSQVARLHQGLRDANGGATANSPVARLTSKFIALVQALIDRQSFD